jgi:hypothetical protein
MHAKVYAKNLKEKDLCGSGRIILKMVLRRQVARMWT